MHPLADGSDSGGGSEEQPHSSNGGSRPAWGRLAWPRPARQLRASGGSLDDELEDEEGEGEEEEEEAADWDDDLGDFVVEDEDTAAAAFAEL